MYEYDCENGTHGWSSLFYEGLAREFGGPVLRYTFPQEMATLMHYCGFNVLRCCGDWDGSPLTASSPRMIYVCQGQ